MKTKLAIIILISFTLQSCYINTIKFKDTTPIGLDSNSVKDYSILRSIDGYTIISVDQQPVNCISKDQIVSLSPGSHTIKVHRNYYYNTYESNSQRSNPDRFGKYNVVTSTLTTKHYLNDTIDISFDFMKNTSYCFGGPYGRKYKDTHTAETLIYKDQFMYDTPTGRALRYTIMYTSLISTCILISYWILK